MKVSLLEGVDESRTVLRAMVERPGCRVVEATNGKEAVWI